MKVLRKKLIAGISFLLMTFAVFSQSDFGFRSPLDIPVILSGSFQELRGNHFHSGIDIKTQGREGHKIYSIQEGWVVRIKVSPYGFGHALYVQHPNGYTSVYGHLQRFSPEIQTYVRRIQYQRKKFAVDLYPERGKFPLKKGDVIAYSGNSGGSGGPHLHFEIRNSANSKPLNPLIYGFLVKDHRAPVIQEISFTPLNSGSVISGKNQRKAIPIKSIKKDNINVLPDTLQVFGDFDLGVKLFDRLDGAENKNGIFVLKIYLDNILHFYIDATAFSFDESRYINSLIDYSIYKQQRKRFIRTYKQPGNKLSIYRSIKNNGIFSLNVVGLHKIRIEASDFTGNKTILEQTVEVVRPIKIDTETTSSSKYFFFPNSSNDYTDSTISIHIPKGALYDTLNFKISSKVSSLSSYSKVYEIQDPGIPLHKYISISIKPSKDISNIDASKLLLGRIRNGRVTDAGGKYQNGYVVSKVRDFGTYCITADTKAPKITFLGSKTMSKRPQRLKFKVVDNLSGIGSYNAYVDGKWVLLQYDPKKNLMYYQFDDHCPSEAVEFVIKVRDDKGNSSSLKVNIPASI